MLQECGPESVGDGLRKAEGPAEEKDDRLCDAAGKQERSCCFGNGSVSFHPSTPEPAPLPPSHSGQPTREFLSNFF